MAELEWLGHLENKIGEGKYTREEVDALVHEEKLRVPAPPLLITIVPRFYQCLNVLTKMFQNELPHVVDLRATTCQVVVYGFVDASGSGFGSTMLVKSNIEYRIGTWSSTEDVNSSNWRECENLVCEVEQAGIKG